MIIGVMSDTHGDAAAIRRAVAAAGPVNQWLHGGDYSQDRHFLADLTGLPVVAVKGNCDGETEARLDEYIEVGPVKIWLTHGHRYQAKEREQELAWWAGQYGVQVVVYGHTHVTYSSWHSGILIFNPGSPSRPRGGSPASCGLLEIHSDGSVEVRLVEIARK